MPALNNPRLILTPRQKDFQTDNMDNLISQLKEANFIGMELNPAEDFRCFEFGDDYLHMISYLGCSPAVTSLNEAGENESFISIKQFEQIQFGFSSSVPPARCPHCNKTEKNWQQLWQHWQHDPAIVHECAHCHSSFHFTDMKWKKNGGTGSLLLQVHGIQEHLAVPAPALTELLQQTTGTAWHYFFACKHDN